MKTNSPNPTEHNQWYPFQDRPSVGEMVNQQKTPLLFQYLILSSAGQARFIIVGAGVQECLLRGTLLWLLRNQAGERDPRLF
ncbi:MAG: hypothetical protein CM1200mP30_25610 [Pseudomonadota bacterium]|nr:MAG: hypothetical protein CM1200mP30_25610 [Pseudomonadota bacterium]